MQPVPQVPGVYIVEQNAFPNAVVEVATAIPAFIGYTEKAVYKGRPLAGIPTKVESLKEFEDRFGGAFRQVFDLVVAGTASDGGNTQPAAAPTGAIAGGSGAQPAPGKLPPVSITFYSGAKATLTPQGRALFYLYKAMQLFYLNGGGSCYIVSVGDYDHGSQRASARDFSGALATLKAEQDPTMLLCPDALMLLANDYNTVMQEMLSHCGEVQNRVALLDLYGGTGPGTPPTLGDDVANFRNAVQVQNDLQYGIAYFPWLNTTVVTPADVSFLNLSAAALSALPGAPAAAASTTAPATVASLATLVSSTAPPASASAIMGVAPAFVQGYQALVGTSLSMTEAAELETLRATLHNRLKASSPEYQQLLNAMATHLSQLPAAPAMAGVYTAVDAARGVWKAPANVSLNAVIAPTVAVSDSDQAGLNVDALTGKSINVIRAFKGMGTLVWGARTLDGNSQDWRYLNVRRTVIMMEQSIKLAARNTVFEPNDANTWVTLKSMLESFLFNLWKQGALAGAAPADAYQVQIGLGTTMTADDILNGIMNVTVRVALVRPAEFILVTFQQEMQKS